MYPTHDFIYHEQIFYHLPLLSVEEYILPPVEVPEKIEELTGIKDSFLRYGGYDDALGKQRDGPARVFADVFLDFQLFCKDRAQGKKLVLVAHNARFDKGMLNGELRRLRTSESSQDSLASSLSDVFDSSLDSLQLFRDRRMWKLSIKTDAVINRPDSFKLGSIYHHVFREMLPNSHNAVGDIQALDRLLMEHNTFYGWKNLANDILQ
jgi:DNA polymerase III epsilon subunit-like protein